MSSDSPSSSPLASSSSATGANSIRALAAAILADLRGFAAAEDAAVEGAAVEGAPELEEGAPELEEAAADEASEPASDAASKAYCG